MRLITTKNLWAGMYGGGSFEIPAGSEIEIDMEQDELDQERSDCNMDGMDVPRSIEVTWLRSLFRSNLRGDVTVDDVRAHCSAKAYDAKRAAEIQQEVDNGHE